MSEIRITDKRFRVITTKYLPATNTLPARVKSELAGTAIKAMLPWDYDAEGNDGHAGAAKQLLQHAITRNGFESWCATDWEIESAYLGLPNVHFVHICRPVKR